MIAHAKSCYLAEDNRKSKLEAKNVLNVLIQPKIMCWLLNKEYTLTYATINMSLSCRLRCRKVYNR